MILFRLDKWTSDGSGMNPKLDFRIKSRMSRKKIGIVDDISKFTILWGTRSITKHNFLISCVFYQFSFSKKSISLIWSEENCKDFFDLNIIPFRSWRMRWNIWVVSIGIDDTARGIVQRNFQCRFCWNKGG